MGHVYPDYSEKLIIQLEEKLLQKESKHYTHLKNANSNSPVQRASKERTRAFHYSEFKNKSFLDLTANRVAYILSGKGTRLQSWIAHSCA